MARAQISQALGLIFEHTLGVGQAHGGHAEGRFARFDRGGIGQEEGHVDVAHLLQPCGDDRRKGHICCIPLAVDARHIVNMEQPAEAVGIVLAHHCLRGRVNAKLRQLAIYAEFREAGARAEQAMAIDHMRLQRRQQRVGRGFDQREIFARAADNRHPPDLAGAELFGKALARRQPAALHRVKGEPAAHLDLVHILQPAVAEHRLGHPFIGEILDQVRDEGACRVWRNHGTFGVTRLQIINQRGGIIVERPIGIFHHRDDRCFDPGQRLARVRTVDPEMRNTAIAHQRAHLHRIG